MGVLISTKPGQGYEVLGEVEISSEQDVKDAVAAAQKAKKGWKETPIEKRIALLSEIRDAFAKKRDEFIQLIHEEVGKSWNESKAEFDDFLNDEFETFLANGKEWLAINTTHKEGTKHNRIVYEPHGVATVILPWNYPLEMFCWGVIPNLVAGNVVIMKHSEECPIIGKRIEEIMNSANLPVGVFSEIYGDGRVGSMLVDKQIDLLWFTGSSAVGKKLYKRAGEKFIKSIMELGGSNPGIVFENADLEKCAEHMFTKRFSNNGQSCNALKRLLVHESLFDATVQRLAQIAKNKRVGNSKDADYGSLVAKRQLDTLLAQIADAEQKGAKIIVGGKQPDAEGAYYLPTILTDVTFDMRVWKEEVFGPVLTVVPFKTEEEAIKLANDTEYGLGAYIFTEDKDSFRRVALQIDAGMIMWNKGGGTYACPFGGYKCSGMGREHGKHGYRELCQVKLIAE